MQRYVQLVSTPLRVFGFEARLANQGDGDRFEDRLVAFIAQVDELGVVVRPIQECTASVSMVGATKRPRTSITGVTAVGTYGLTHLMPAKQTDANGAASDGHYHTRCM